MYTVYFYDTIINQVRVLSFDTLKIMIVYLNENDETLENKLRTNNYKKYLNYKYTVFKTKDKN